MSPADPQFAQSTVSTPSWIGLLAANLVLILVAGLILWMFRSMRKRSAEQRAARVEQAEHVRSVEREITADWYTCERCEHPNRTGARLCAECGTVFRRLPGSTFINNVCPTCNVENEDEARFCSACGDGLPPPEAR